MSLLVSTSPVKSEGTVSSSFDGMLFSLVGDAFLILCPLALFMASDSRSKFLSGGSAFVAMVMVLEMDVGAKQTLMGKKVIIMIIIIICVLRFIQWWKQVGTW